MQSPDSIEAQKDAPLTPAGVRRQPQPSIDVRSASLAVITGLAGIYAMHWAAAVVIPVLLVDGLKPVGELLGA